MEPEAARLLMRTLGDARDAGDQTTQALVLDAAAQILAELGGGEAAALVHGAMQGVEYRTNAPSAAIHARLREATLRQLGRERFDELLAEGARLGLDAAVKLAIRELRDLEAQ